MIDTAERQLDDETTDAPAGGPPSKYVVRYGATRFLGEFSLKQPEDLPRGTAVIVRSDRGVEWGEVLCPATARAREHLSDKNRKGRILRTANEDDHRMLDDVHDREREAFQGGGALIAEHENRMQLVDVEHLFGGERLVFYYLSEERVDFRELVKELAKRYRTRIEMRQIGVRDEAKLLADYGDCGRPVCCNTHLHTMPPVSMKMAKIQKATLDPTKISGRCGRLKCCLRYEYDTYAEAKRELPKVGATIVSKQGQGRIVGQDLLSRSLVQQLDDGRRIVIAEADVVTVVQATRTKPPV
jgi:cell fate regulator YaaT (PSP1 superfamily)